MSDVLLGVGVALLFILSSLLVSAVIVKLHTKKFHYPAGGQRQPKDEA